MEKLNCENEQMDVTYEEKYHNLEKNYWWFKARHNFILNLVKDLDKTFKILEIACSSGVLMELLKNTGFKNIYGIDVSEKAVELCHQKGLKNVSVMGGVELKFEDQKFDLIIASDVLEHIENDSKALQEWQRVLKNNGRLIICVPAFQFLWSGADILNHHFRRYSKEQFVKLLDSAGFKINKCSYFNFSLFFPTFVIRIIQHIFGKNKELKDQLHEVNPVLDYIILQWLKIEYYLLKRINYPLGISIYAIAPKKV